MTEPTKVVIYCRTACSPGMEKDDALHAQEKECRAYAETHGMEVTGVYYDPGISGMTADRPGWQAMMQVLQNASAPHGVLIRDITRLARDLALSDELEAACNRLGHEIIVVDENYDAGYEPILPGMLQSLIRLLKKHEDHQL